jgi:hypothetical protein
LLTDPGDTGGARHDNAIGSKDNAVVISDAEEGDMMDTAPPATPPAAAAPAAGALSFVAGLHRRCALQTAHHDCRRWRQPFVAAHHCRCAIRLDLCQLHSGQRP